MRARNDKYDVHPYCPTVLGLRVHDCCTQRRRKTRLSAVRGNYSFSTLCRSDTWRFNHNQTRWLHKPTRSRLMLYSLCAPCLRLHPLLFLQWLLCFYWMCLVYHLHLGIYRAGFHGHTFEYSAKTGESYSQLCLYFPHDDIWSSPIPLCLRFNNRTYCCLRLTHRRKREQVGHERYQLFISSWMSCPGSSFVAEKAIL